MMRNKLIWIFTFLPLIVTVVALYFLPDTIPMHYDLNGNINRWGSKYEELVFPMIILVTTLLWKLMIKYYEKKASQASESNAKIEAVGNVKILYVVTLGTIILFNIMCYTFLYGAWKAADINATTAVIDFNKIISFVLGLFFIAIGNFLPRSKRNSMLGVRTSWSMANDRSWYLSNKYGGIIFVVSGICIITESLLFKGPTAIFVMLGIIILAAILAVSVSYLVYKNTNTPE